ncbi:MAG: site-specific tyrosine recombinase [Marinirhabdus sp.]
MKWSRARTHFQDYLRIERGLSANSIVNYGLDIKKMTLWLKANGLDTPPTEITEETLQKAIYDVGKTVGPKSQNRFISGLKSFFDYLIFEGLRETNPVDLVERPKLGRKLPSTLSTQEVDALIAAINLGTPQGERNRAMLETLYGCGLRVSELVNLRLSDLFFNEGFIKVTGKGDKQRFVPIAAHTQKYIDLYRTHVRVRQKIHPGFSDILFLNRRGRALGRAMVFTIVKQLAENVGIDKKISPHTFRHSFATHLLENGANLRAIQQMLGHESITTTEIYTHIDKKHLVMEKYHPHRKG